MNHVFITGLPRSRSAWFANLLTWGDSFVYHDGFDDCETFDDFKEKLDIPYRVVGNSDPANVLFWKRIVAEWPDATWIVIERGVNDVYASIDKVIGECAPVPLEAVLKHEELLSELLDHVKAHVFNFNSLNKDDCRQIAQLCDVSIDELRLEMLWKLNVQMDPRLMRDRIAALIENPPQLLKELAA